MSLFTQAKERVTSLVPARVVGTIADVVGLTIEAADFAAPLGAMARIERRQGGALMAEIVGFRHGHTLLMPLGDMRGVSRGDSVELLLTQARVATGEGLLGRIVDALGRPLDGKSAPLLYTTREVFADAPAAMGRPPIRKPLLTGIRAIDGLFTCGRGQRVGLFAGSGVGKSTLMGMLCRNSDADAMVVCLVGERGRELRDFIEHSLGAEGLARSVVVCATSDEPPLLRVRSAFAATAIAESLRDQGRHVLLLMDSVTRLAMAQREIGLSAGEPPTTKGYPPSVFAMLPRLLERAGNAEKGSITAFYTVLVDGDDVNEPIADALRGILDGHLWLSRELANRGHFPAIRVDDSISRLMADVTQPEHQTLATRLRRLFTLHRQNEDLVNIGAYHRGSNAELDEAITLMPKMLAFLAQRKDEKCLWPQTLEALRQATASGALRANPRPAAPKAAPRSAPKR